MDTIKDYLEAMFASMPNTAEVRKAKSELLSMMEDKYNEMIADGISENTAVGTVISEFGNLDELADDLGLTKEVEVVKEQHADNRRLVSSDEIQGFLATESKNAWRIGIGVLLCITCVIYPMLLQNKFGPCGMFLSIGVAVALFVFSGFSRQEWEYIQKEPCRIDLNTAEAVRAQRKSFKSIRALLTSVGVLLCATCFVPAIVTHEGPLSGGLLFVFIGLGVFLFVYTNVINSSYDQVLGINDGRTISGRYGKEPEENRVFINKKAEAVMSVYRPTVICIYLILSFLTMAWHLTWLIFPVAAVIRKILNIALTEEEE
ncbi:MAG: permease prefix domain 1-containing protein [Pseudobutyrivibrio sp.]|nr:permease prefix domain 1-containing protein [Pseudobutyrivibrio sp.]